MRYGSVKHIALYYKAIPGMLRLLRQERAELEGNYYGLRGLACDGMPRGSSPGKPTEESGLQIRACFRFWSHGRWKTA